MRPALLLMLLGTAGCGGDAPQTSVDWGGVRPPDVVVVLLDTLRADALSIYGGEREVAPFLARLARESVVFERAWSTSTWTAPATASVLTGCYPDRHGVTRGFLAHFREEEGGRVEQAELERIELHGIARNVATLAEHFRDLGYTTYGLATNINIGSEMEFDRGFDHFERLHQAPAKDLRARLLEWKDDLAGDQPTFLYLHFNDVHEPYHLRPRFYAPPDDPEDEVARFYAHYQSEIGYVDSFLARLFGELGWGEDTVLAVVADHGEEFMDHGRMAHEFSLYGELSQVPMLIHGPALGVRPGRYGENVSLIDLAPTLLALIGRPAQDLDGRSLAELCRREDKTPDPDEQRVFSERPHFLHRFERGRTLWGVVFDEWKLIQHDDGRVELYDLSSDPGETVNLAAERSRRCDRLLSLLDGHRERGVQADSVRADVAIDEEMLEQLKAIGYVK